MKKLVTILFVILISVSVHAQSGAYLIPRNIFIGDKAILVLPLPRADQNTDITLTPLSSRHMLDANFPYHENIDFHRIVLERRTGGSRLLIEFTAFIPGLIELPDIEIGGERYTGLSVTVNSIIESRSTRNPPGARHPVGARHPAGALVLSGPASSLSMPGTALMLYGTTTVLINFILLTMWFIIKGRSFIQIWGKKLLRWKFFLSMKLMEKMFYRSVLMGMDKRIILDKLSYQFRKFLSFLTENDCHSMTAHDFEAQNFYPSFLGVFFRRCDELRFSGANINSQDIYNLLIDLNGFLKLLLNAKTPGNTMGSGYQRLAS